MRYLLPIILLLLCGCTKKVTETVYRHTTDTLYQSRTLIDRIIERDSVLIYQRGDTVFQDRIKWRYRGVAKADTVYQSRIDTLYRDKVRYVERRVEKELTWWQQTRLRGFWVLLAVLLALLGWYRWGHLLRKSH